MIQSYFFYAALFALITWHRPFLPFASANLAVQGALFLLLAAIPAYRTKRMNYVDLAWPFGLCAIGVLSLTYLGHESVRSLAIGSIYLVIGGRMAFGATWMWWKGHFQREFPRYLYQRLRWEKKGLVDVDWVMQKEIFLQGAANASLLVLPALIQNSNPAPELSALEIVGYALWALSFLFESVADAQKQAFITKNRHDRQAVCSVGLWRYSRHPNYFGEWMSWNSLIIASLPSVWNLWQTGPKLWALGLGVGLALISKIMHECLVHYTGAVPAEHFSLQKRPGYRAYMARTNQFFPGPVKKS